MNTNTETDPLEEIWRVREEFAARFNNDLHAMAAYLRAKQGEDGRKVVNLHNTRRRLTPEELRDA
jgi:hypothetical protein